MTAEQLRNTAVNIAWRVLQDGNLRRKDLRIKSFCKYYTIKTIFMQELFFWCHDI